MSYFQEKAEWVTIVDGEVVYRDTRANFDLDSTVVVPGLPEGITERIYETGVRHALMYLGDVVDGGPKHWPQADLAIANIALLLQAKEAREYAPPPPPGPITVAASSAKLVLADDGIYSQVETICLDPAAYVGVRIYWTSANTWVEDNPYVLAIGTELGLADSQMHNMFERALLK